MKRLTPGEEVEFLKEIRADPNVDRIVTELRESFNVMQARSQLLLGLITICLTITGFSGAKIAESSAPARLCIFGGVLSVLVAALLLVIGPLHLRWLTRYRAATMNETLRQLIQRRDSRTRLYHLATLFLLVGLGGYVLSLGFFLLAQ